MNKKADGFWIISCIGIVGIMLLSIPVIGLLDLMEKKGSCEYQTYILKGVNGITDQNDGLLSGGDVSKTTLLMENGEVITLRYIISELKLGEPITIKRCKSLLGSEILKIKEAD